MAVSERKCEMLFKSDSEMQGVGRLNEKGDIIVKATSLDSEINSKITAIKMDVEGAEFEVLSCAKNHIMNEKPALIISVYHKYDAIQKLVDLVKTFREDYKFYLRCGQETFAIDFILFAV